MPIHDLRDVHAAARDRRIEYRGRKVMRDTANLGYDLDDVADCLLCLSEREFRKSHVRDVGPSDDEYICCYPRPGSDDDEAVDRLYVKFRLVDDCLIVDLGSFHLA
ncbi:type II toxin-antitoxin system MqsR family toxin [Aidingimonas halophila]|uniref:Motility quorum-sensing regulator, toxin of MqsA n=1 Tax=Aidingimonas halophila TaxID=574349 RepID=A0A1H3CQB6_9GAMM|nr:hypothetical protein GCM10008094_30240 [Aidingimonas halophila]SDX56088.1 Motility quorum-sensing regulator, toxin of MqsA [Aidingimonas halophila]